MNVQHVSHHDPPAGSIFLDMINKGLVIFLNFEIVNSIGYLAVIMLWSMHGIKIIIRSLWSQIIVRGFGTASQWIGGLYAMFLWTSENWWTGNKMWSIWRRFWKWVSPWRTINLLLIVIQKLVIVWGLSAPSTHAINNFASCWQLTTHARKGFRRWEVERKCIALGDHKDVSNW